MPLCLIFIAHCYLKYDCLIFLACTEAQLTEKVKVICVYKIYVSTVN